MSEKSESVVYVVNVPRKTSKTEKVFCAALLILAAYGYFQDQRYRR